MPRFLEVLLSPLLRAVQTAFAIELCVPVRVVAGLADCAMEVERRGLENCMPDFITAADARALAQARAPRPPFCFGWYGVGAPAVVSVGAPAAIQCSYATRSQKADSMKLGGIAIAAGPG